MEALGEAAVARVRGQQTDVVWQEPGTANPELHELADVLSEAERVEQAPTLHVVKDIKSASESVLSESRASSLFSESEQLQHLTHPYTAESDHVEPHREQTSSADELSLQKIGVESAKQTAGAARWLAGTALGVLKTPLQRGVKINTEVLEELEVPADQQETVRVLVDDFDLERPAIISNRAAVLVHELRAEMGQAEELKDPQAIKDRFVRIVTAATNRISVKQARFALRLQGPRSLLGQ